MANRTRTLQLALLLVCSTFLAQPLSAQENTGTIIGVVTDTTGLVLPGVTVTVKQAETGFTREVVTGAAGAYTAGLLPPGTYTVVFRLEGFSPRTTTNIALRASDRLDISGAISVSDIAVTVEVSAAQQFIQPMPAVQNLMGPTQVQELPLNNRNFVQLATLVPGVTSDLSDEVGVGLTSTVSISVNGGRRNAVNWMVDGVSNVDVGSNITLLSTPTLESIQEFKIITSSYAAEYARSGGGVINIVTKSGTSRFSGSAYEFYRDDTLNANSFFRNRSSNPKDADNAAPLDYNNFGYTIGGPILPWRDKAFFFWSQEWRRIERAGEVTANTVNPLWLSDPSNANYVAPADRDPNAVRLLEAFPAPNLGTAQYLNTNPNINNTRQEVLRVDVDLTSNMRLTGRYTHDLSETQEIGGLFFGVALPNIATTDTRVPGQVAAVELRSMHGQFMNEAKYQFSTNRIASSTPEGTRNTRAQFGLTTPELFPANEHNRIPTIVIAGLSTFGAAQLYNIEYFNHTVMNNLTWQRGNHTVKVGAMAAFESKNENAANETQGRYSFVATTGGRTAFQNFLTGNRDGLCGTGCTYSEAENEVLQNLRFNRYEMFAQDTWRAAPGLTLDYGVRYALYPHIVDANDVLTNFDPSLYDPAQAPTYANAAGSAIIRGTGSAVNGIVIAGQNSAHGRGIYATDKNNIQPRAGFAWDPTQSGTMIVRGGIGVYYDQPLVGMFEQNSFVNPPFANTVSVQNPSLSNPSAGVAPGTVGVRNLIASSDPFDTPRMLQWNVGVQRQLYARGMVDVGYVGSRGDNQIQPVDINQPQPQDVIAQGGLNVARPYDGYGSINMRQTTAYSRYHGLLMSFRHEAGRDGSVTLNYTLSRNQTTATNDRDAVDIPQNPLDLDAEYADARSDRRHVFSGTFVYELPFFRDGASPLARAVLGGWQIAGIVNATSGPPIPRILTNTDGGRRGNQANQVGDPAAGSQNFPYWFDPAAFAPPALGAYGTAGRAPFRLPGRHQWDLTVSKNWYPGSLRFQFRADFINAFNQTQWLAVNADCSATGTSLTLGTCAVGGTNTFGQITSTRAPREIQLGLKLYW